MPAPPTIYLIAGPNGVGKTTTVDVRRRFSRSIVNLVEVYLDLADRWTIWDATAPQPVPVLHSSRSGVADVRSILLS